MSVVRLTYSQAIYRKPEECISGIRERVCRGWQISEIRGPIRGSYEVIFRRQDGAAGELDPAHGTGRDM